jgi:hypothetical protein
MSLYAIKNDEGEWLNLSGVNSHWHEYAGDFCAEPSATLLARRHHGHVVTLIEEPALIVVSEEEAEMLDQAKCDDDPAELIVGFVNSHDKYDDDSKAEDRLMRAYVIGWTVEKQKRWNVKVPHTGAGWWYAKPDPDINHGKGCARPAFTGINNPQVRLTDAEVIKYGLQDCEKTEVTDDEQ